MIKNLSNKELLEYNLLWQTGLNKTKRFESQKIHNTDLKFSYHVVRLLDEVEQILTQGDIDLRRNREHLKAIRRGDISEQDIRKWAADKELALEKLYESSKLPWGPDEDTIKQLLLNCLEEHFGNLDACIVTDQQPVIVLREIADIIDKNKNLFME